MSRKPKSTRKLKQKPKVKAVKSKSPKQVKQVPAPRKQEIKSAKPSLQLRPSTNRTSKKMRLPVYSQTQIVKQPSFSEKSSQWSQSIQPQPVPTQWANGAPELPHSYNVTRLVLMVRDPYTVFCYWDFSSETWSWIQGLFKKHHGNLKVILRIYDVTNIEFDGSHSNSSHDIDVSLEAKNWYAHVSVPNREWVFDLALISSSGDYYLIVRSNRVRTPRDGPSDVIDENWMIADFDRIYALSGGFGIGMSSAEVRRLIKERYLIQRALFSGSPGGSYSFAASPKQRSQPA
ncbi:MAG: DUF4912 domain-containing protein [Candidatus Omnitrophica bacterium]|nr:DUF4912 domain-containing protein [Candidatus Omnitrophota bacterium]